MASTVRPPGARALRLSGLPGGADAPLAGGVAFVAYCLAGEARAGHRRQAVQRARARYQTELCGERDAYPAALIYAQRLGVALEDLGRLVIALKTLGGSDAFEALRGATYRDLDALFSELRSEQELRSAFRLPAREEIEELPQEELRGPLLNASEILAARWARQWRVCAGGWPLLRRLAKGMRHGAPLIGREIVLSPPGAGALGAGIADRFERWVLLIDTEHDPGALTISTQWSVADLSEATLKRAHHAVLDGISLAEKLASAHVGRVSLGYKWVLDRDVLKALPAEQRRLLEKHLDA